MARHFSELNIRAFRGIVNLEIPNLGDVNILLGNNNCGKTSVLEAIQLVCDPSEYNIFKVGTQRIRYQKINEKEFSPTESLKNIMNFSLEPENEMNYKIDISLTSAHKPISFETMNKELFITGRLLKVLKKGEEIDAIEVTIGNSYFDNNKKVIVYTSDFEQEYSAFSRVNNVKPDINFKAIYTIDHLIEPSFANILNNKAEISKVIKLLKHFDDSILDLRYVSRNGFSMPVIDTKDYEAMPLSSYGDGIKKVLTIIDAIVSSQNGIVLIDEFEAAIHTTAMNEVFSFIIKACKEMNVQLFLTTHSIEAVDKFLNCDKNELDNIRIITLRKKNGKTYARVLDGNKAENLRFDNNAELR